MSTQPTYRAVLAVMLTDPEAEWYGLDLSEGAGLKPGRIYPTLDQMLKLRWVERRWETHDPDVVGHPRRRLYRLTDLGRKRAGELVI